MKNIKGRHIRRLFEQYELRTQRRTSHRLHKHIRDKGRRTPE